MRLFCFEGRNRPAVSGSRIRTNWIQIQLISLSVTAVIFSGSARAQAEPGIVVSIDFPDGSTKSTRVTLDEIDELPAYKLLPWVKTALRELGSLYLTETDAKGVKITSIGGIANDPTHEWIYVANGVTSPYRLDTQTIEDVTRIVFSYRERTP